MTVLCEHCLSFSVITVKHNHCCEIRLIAGMPPDRIKTKIDRVKATEGEMAAVAYRGEIAAEYRRAVKHRASLTKKL